MCDDDRLAGKQRVFLEAIDVRVARLAEYAQVGGKTAQRRAPDHEAVARGVGFGDRVEIPVGDDRGDRGVRHRRAGGVVQHALGRCGEILDPPRHARTRQRRRQRFEVVHGIVQRKQARVLRLDRLPLEQDLVRLVQLRDPEFRVQVHHFHPDDVEHRPRLGRLRERGRCEDGE